MLIPGTDPDIIARYETLQKRAREASFGLFEDEYAVLDTETTGITPAYDALIEVAVAIVQGTQIIRRFTSFVNPGRPIPEFISELTGITDEDVKGAPSGREVVKSLDEFIGNHRIIAHNASFDRAFIEKYASAGSTLGEASRWIDSLELSRIALPRLKEHKLQTLSELFCETSSTHRAIDDVEALCFIWRVLLVGISDLPLGLARLLAGLFPRTTWPLREVLVLVAGSIKSTFSLVEARRAREGKQRLRQKTDAIELEGGILSLKPVESEELRKAFSEQGLLAKMYGQFEPRAEQLAMASEIAEALASSNHRVIEAGTGVGKSMAYLLPLVLFAERNQVTCGVATKTNALLDQLMYHELPRLDAALPKGVSYVALKGFGHYPCLRKLMNLSREDRFFETSNAPAVVAMLLSFVCQSARGDLDPLALHLGELARYEICASTDDCLRHKCRLYQSCLLHGARRAARKADIVITNHALLFCDMQADGRILPPIRHWVVDEAHGMEAEARSQLSFRLEPRALKQTLRGLTGSMGPLSSIKRLSTPATGASVILNEVKDPTLTESDFPVILSVAKDLTEADNKILSSDLNDRNQAVPPTHFSPALDDSLVRTPLAGSSLLVAKATAAQEEARMVEAVTDSFTTALKELCEIAEKNDYNQVDLWINEQVRESALWGALILVGTSLATRIEKLWQSCRDIVSYCDEFEELKEQQSDMIALTANLRANLDALLLILDGSNKDYYYYAELDRRADATRDCLIASRVDVGEVLLECLYPETRSAIFTSATLAAGESFEYFARGCGLDRLQPELWKAIQLDSSYDFDSNMAVYLPTDIPEPNSIGYLDALERLLFEVHVALGGSVLTLYTNRRDMEALYQRLKDRLANEGITLRFQTRRFSAKRLRDEFLENESFSLFALRSFWEGFDAPGDTLRCVVIPKLPFSKPTDPLMQERSSRKENVWQCYMLPEAIIDLKQAAGRLIRSSTDTGALILADSRLLTKSYGRAFLTSLPSSQHYKLTSSDIASALRHRYN